MIRYKRFWSIVLGICCVLVLWPAYPLTAQESLYLLLEKDATYQLKLSYTNTLRAQTPTLSIYTYNDQDSVLQLSHMYRNLLYDRGEVSLVFKTPEGASRALIKLEGAGLKDHNITIERIDKLDTEKLSSLAQMIVNNQLYTGLIIDARGLGVERGMSPRIWTESGELLYGGVTAPYEYVLKEGVISYGTELSADLMQRVSIPGKIIYTAPLIVQAKAAAGVPRTGVVVSQEAADKIVEALQNYDFFAHYAVVFLID